MCFLIHVLLTSMSESSTTGTENRPGSAGALRMVSSGLDLPTAVWDGLLSRAILKKKPGEASMYNILHVIDVQNKDTSSIS
jgi:hypothetical protein